MTFASDYVQSSNDSNFSTTANLVVKTNGNSLRLLKRDNSVGTVASPGTLDVSTKGGNFQIASNSPLSFTKLDTAGGWVVLDTTGKIDASNVSAGSVSFRAGGSVSLTGAFAAASGTGSSIVLNNSAVGAVLGGDSLGQFAEHYRLRLDDPGRRHYWGCRVAITTPTVVARDSAVVSNGGRIEFARGAAALNALVGLRVDAGYGGVIALGGSIGECFPVPRLGRAHWSYQQPVG